MSPSEGEDRLLPELDILGWLRFTRAFDHGLEPDQHAKEFELHYIVNGEVNWWVKKSPMCYGQEPLW